jgi:hypothetical protein
MGSDVELFAVRDDVDAEYTAGKLKKEMGDKLKPIPISAEITSYLDSKKRLDSSTSGRLRSRAARSKWPPPRRTRFPGRIAGCPRSPPGGR